MTSILLRPLRQLTQALISHDAPRQVAWGFVIGMFIGLIPKGNLVVVALALMLCALRVNKPAGVLAAGLFSMAGFFLDGLAHHLGSIVLLWEQGWPASIWLYELPLGPWIGLNNTVVVGHLLLGLYFAYPAYWLAHRFACRVQPRMSRWLLRYRAVRWMRGLELGARMHTE